MTGQLLADERAVLRLQREPVTVFERSELAVPSTMETKSTVVRTRPGSRLAQARAYPATGGAGSPPASPGIVELKTWVGTGEALEPMRTEIPQEQVVDQGVFDQGGGRLRHSTCPPWPAS